MDNNFKSRNPKLIYQLWTLFFASSFVFGIHIFRANKASLVHSIYEELMPYFHRISHIGGLIDTTNNEERNKRKYISGFLKYFFSFSIFKGETEEAKLLPLLKIDIPYNQISILRKDRIKSIKRGYLSNPSWANGTISINGEEVEAKFRLKGDLGQHWMGDKRFSLRVRTKKNKNDLGKPSILGMKTFSLHKLGARQFPYENIFQETLMNLGFHHVPHKIVKVKVNGDYWGLMDMQEHFSSALLEKNKMRDSLIFTFSNDARFAYRFDESEPISHENYWLDNPRLFLKLTGKSFQKASEIEKKQFSYVQSILKRKNYQDILFSKRHLKDASDLLNLWGDFHPINLSNTKFYLNPFSLKLEPLLADQGPFRENKNGFKDGVKLNTGGFLKVDNYKKNDNYKFKNNVKKQLSKYEPFYKLENDIFPENANLNIQAFKNNFKDINKDKLNNINSKSKYPDRIKCSDKNFSIPSNYPAIQAKYTINQIRIMPLICGEFIFKEVNICNYNFALNYFSKPKVISIYKPEIINIKNKNLITKLEKNLDCFQSENFISYTFNGDQKNELIEPLVNQELNINPLLSKNWPDFIITTKKDKFLIESGIWDINKPIVIKGELKIQEGTILRFSPNSYLIINGNLMINGTKTNPVLMTSYSKDSTWKGLYVYNNSKEKYYSEINSLKVSNTKNTNVGILNLTGGVTFYNTKIFIDDLEITDSQAEDALNIVNGELSIGKMNIMRSKSDAFDCDFCEGLISDLNLEDIGGDGLDISGSNINAVISKANNVKDKVVSIGEESIAKLSINAVMNSYLAAAIKDGSQAEIKLKNIQTYGPLAMSYLKKDFYDENTITNIYIDDNEIDNISNKFLAGKKTIMKINNKLLNSKDIDVKKLYEVGPMKKIK